ncbi:UDP-glycosyltransferase UGT5-like isoform X2 [Harmonia axyridis]|nr:UDP-glycosyltransferase UGT5-like isoform X2 [Harmonia axyridis]
MMQRIVTLTTAINELFWEEPNIQKLITEKPKYDAVILMTFFNDGILGIGHHLGVPTVIFNNVGTFSLWNNYVANPTMPYSQDPLFSIPTDNFFGRLTTVTGNLLLGAMSIYQIDSVNQALLNKYLPTSPPLRVLQKNVSIVLANSHVSIEPARPYVPNMIQIGGFHVQETKPLPADIKRFLDDAKEGAILFSLGSNLKVEMMEEQKRKDIFKVLGELSPMRVVIKSEMAYEGVASNIMMKSWLPQADILGHPNIKLFVSHGGLGGNIESIYHGVPILGIPFYGDQLMNMHEAQVAGYAKILHPQDITEDLFRHTLKEMLNNPKYQQIAKIRSALMREQPVKPMDTAAFWIEHIIKFGGGSHLKNAGADLEWYQLYMVDIYVFYTVVVSSLTVLIIQLIKIFLRLLKRVFVKSNPKVKKS